MVKVPTNVEEFLCNCLAQKGDRYVFGAEVPLTAMDGSQWDCSELTQFASGGLLPDGAYNQWIATKKAGTTMTVATAMRTRGALLFHGDGTGTGRDAITHVAVSLGDGTTIEARGRLWGVGTWAAAGRFQFAGKVPKLNYAVKPLVAIPAPKAPPFPGKILTLKSPFMTGYGIATAERRLRDLGFYKGAIDDIFGNMMDRSVRAFQSRRHLTVDGDIGKITWGALWK